MNLFQSLFQCFHFERTVHREDACIKPVVEDSTTYPEAHLSHFDEVTTTLNVARKDVTGCSERTEENENSEGDHSTSSSPKKHISTKPLQSKFRVDYNDLTFHQLIGKGSFKAVYRGRWNNTSVAIVSMRKGGMVTEARVLQRMSNHPNLVQFYRWAADTQGNEYMIMEYVREGPLDKLLLLKGNSLHTRIKLAMCEQICSAMCELSDENVVHRDLAARNILVASMDPVHVKVSDFGLARVHPSTSSLSSCCSTGMPTTVPVRWSPPEVLTQYQWSEKSDVWSFGVTAWEIFNCGNEPYANMSDDEVVRAVSAHEVLPRPIRCPKNMYNLMLRCWEHDPSDRPTFAEVLHVFKTWRNAYTQQKRRHSRQNVVALMQSSGAVQRPSDSSGLLPGGANAIEVGFVELTEEDVALATARDSRKPLPLALRVDGISEPLAKLPADSERLSSSQLPPLSMPYPKCRRSASMVFMDHDLMDHTKVVFQSLPSSVDDIIQLSPASLPLSDDCSTGKPAVVSIASCASPLAGMVCEPSTSDKLSNCVVSLRLGLEGNPCAHLSGRVEGSGLHGEAVEDRDLLVLASCSSNSPSVKSNIVIEPNMEGFHVAQHWFGKERWARIKDCESSMDHGDITHMSFEDESRIDPLLSAESTSGLSLRAEAEPRPPTLGDWSQFHPGQLAQRNRSCYPGQPPPRAAVKSHKSTENKMRARSKSTSFNVGSSHAGNSTNHAVNTAAGSGAASMTAPVASRHLLRQSMVLIVGCNAVTSTSHESSNCKRSQTLQGELMGQAGVKAGGHAPVLSGAPISSRSSLPVWLADSPEYGACSSFFEPGESVTYSPLGSGTPTATFIRDVCAQPSHLRYQHPEPSVPPATAAAMARSPYIQMYDLIAAQNSLAAPAHPYTSEQMVVNRVSNTSTMSPFSQQQRISSLSAMPQLE